MPRRNKTEQKSSDKFRDYCFTLNNYTPLEEERLKSNEVLKNVTFMIFGHEIAPTTGTPHLQGYVYFKSPKTIKAANRALVQRVSLRSAIADASANITYCSKDATDVFTHGTPPKQGKRSDLDVCREICRQGGPVMRRVTNEARSIQGVRMAQIWLTYHEPKRDFMPQIYWFYGPTGCGKSEAAKAFLGPSCYEVDQNQWFEGYDGHARILMDEVRPSWISYPALLRLFNHTGYRVQYKGGTRQFLGRVIVCTAPFHPALMYEDCGEPTDQIERRFKQIVYFCKEHNPFKAGEVVPFELAESDDI